MAIMDPIADMFTRIRNAIKNHSDFVCFDFSNVKLAICRLLKSEGFVSGFAVFESGVNKRFIKLILKYDKEGVSLIDKIYRISKPSKRVYVAKKNIPKTLNGFGVSIISTSKGILSGRSARLKNVGGELIGEVY